MEQIEIVDSEIKEKDNYEEVNRALSNRIGMVNATIDSCIEYLLN